MILDHISNKNFYEKTGVRFKKAFEFIQSEQFKTLEPGKYLIDGEDLFVFVMEYDTKNPEDCLTENHRKYIDLQFMMEGEEMVGINTFSNQVATTPYDAEKDAAFYKNEYHSLIKLSKDYFAIFFPQDIHMTSQKIDQPQKVKKAVFKILNDF